jgi:hypothetical protein
MRKLIEICFESFRCKICNWIDVFFGGRGYNRDIRNTLIFKTSYCDEVLA